MVIKTKCLVKAFAVNQRCRKYNVQTPMKKLILMLSIFATGSAYAEFYCDDPEVKADWTNKMERYGYSPNWQHLQATWINLCQKVRDGKIDQNRANELFEIERARVKWREENRLRSNINPVG